MLGIPLIDASQIRQFKGYLNTCLGDHFDVQISDVDLEPNCAILIVLENGQSCLILKSGVCLHVGKVQKKALILIVELFPTKAIGANLKIRDIISLEQKDLREMQKCYRELLCAHVRNSLKLPSQFVFVL